MQFKFRTFLTDQFGALQNVPPLFSRYGLKPPGQEAVQKWHSRDSVPSAWFSLMLALLELEAGEPVKLCKYVKNG